MKPTLFHNEVSFKANTHTIQTLKEKHNYPIHHIEIQQDQAIQTVSKFAGTPSSIEGNQTKSDYSQSGNKTY
jgi:hypothetical protein